MKSLASFISLLLLYTAATTYGEKVDKPGPDNGESTGPTGPAEHDPCMGFQCPTGQECFPMDVVCKKAPCLPVASCRAPTLSPPVPMPVDALTTTEEVPIIITNPCSAMLCDPGYICVLTQPECKKNQECPVQASCEPDPTIKEGRCPDEAADAIGPCDELCTGDDSCPGNEKCCPGCPTQCRVPEFDAITGTVPNPSPTTGATGAVLNPTPTSGVGFPVITCASTMCNAGFRCSDDPVPCETPPCPTKATCHPIVVKLGSCPVPPPVPVGEAAACTTTHDCFKDDECSGDQKCCGTCPKTCVDPVVTVAATTEPPSPPTTVNSTPCSTFDCSDGFECRLDPPQCQVSGCTQTPYCAGLVKDCTSKAETGRCKAAIPRWYYNAAKKTCERFTYGGCGGNANNYITETLCWLNCKPEKEGTCPKPIPGHVGICVVLCTGDSECPNKKKCCNAGGGCPIHCVDPEPASIETTITPPQPTTPANPCETTSCAHGQKCIAETVLCETAPCPTVAGCVQKTIDCSSKPETGNCRASIQRWNYNPITGACETFTYGGCGGNDNNYDTELRCHQACKPDCSSNAETGICDAVIPRWYYSTENCSCQEFNYGGCGGNFNNYETERLCTQTCNADCSSAPVSGMCEAYMPRWYYSPENGTCQTFIYGGCDGNANNYDTEEICNRTCQQEIAITPETVRQTTPMPKCTHGEPLSDVFCGRGLNRRDCPEDYECNIHPTDRYAVCCPKKKKVPTATLR